MLALLKDVARFGCIVVFVLAFALFGRHAYAQSATECRNVKGHLHLTESVTNPDQMSGPVSGALAGTYDFSRTTLTDNTSVPELYLMTGTSVIHTRKGDLNISEAGAIDFETGKFSLLWTVMGGTGKWTNAMGQMVTFGTFNSEAGTGTAHFSGEVCTP